VDPAVDGEVIAGRLEVLSDGDDVAGVALMIGHGHQVVEHVEDFFFAFTDTDHDSGFGDAALDFDALEEFECSFVLGAGADSGVASFDGFEVVGDDLGLRVDDHLEGGLVAFEVPHQNLDRHIRAGFSGPENRFGPDPSAAIREVVAVYRSDDDVLEPGSAERLSDSSWLVFIDGGGLSGFDIAEPAGAGAGVAEDHDGGDTLGPAFAHVRTGGFLADGVEIVRVDGGLGGLESRAAWEFGFEPGGFFLHAQVVDGLVLVVEDH